jgi:hypothetical protein
MCIGWDDEAQRLDSGTVKSSARDEEVEDDPGALETVVTRFFNVTSPIPAAIHPKPRKYLASDLNSHNPLAILMPRRASAVRVGLLPPCLRRLFPSAPPFRLHDETRRVATTTEPGRVDHRRAH